MKNIRFLCIAALAALVALPALAADRTISGTVVAVDDSRMILATADGLKLLQLEPGIERPAEFGSDQVILVDYKDGDTLKATSIRQVDEQIVVEADAGLESMVMLGTVTGSSKDHVTIQTPEGEKAFVIRPQNLTPRPLAPDQRVAMIYHEGDRVGEYTATDLLLVDGFEPSTRAMTVKYTDIEPATTRTADLSDDAKTRTSDLSGDAKADADRRSASSWSDEKPVASDKDRLARADTRSSDRNDMSSTLPQTSSQWVGILLIGLGALGVAIVLGRRV